MELDRSEARASRVMTTQEQAPVEPQGVVRLGDIHIMSEANKRPVCPRCGEPAHEMIGNGKMRVRVKPDGTLGEVVRVVELTTGRVYVCKSDHRWLPSKGDRTGKLP